MIYIQLDKQLPEFVQISVALTKSFVSYHFYGAEDMTEVVATLQILGDVCKRTKVIWVLGGT